MSVVLRKKKYSKMLITVNVDSVRGKLVNCDDITARALYKLCSYQAHNYQFSEAFINGVWDGYVRRFSIKTHLFPSGLLFRVINLLKKKGIKYELNDTRKKFEWNARAVLKNLEDFKYALRPYQIEGVIRGLRVPYMTFWWATSSGKTVQFSALITALKKKESFRITLILVANKDLAAQHRDELGEMLGEKIGVIEEGRFEPRAITVAVINTLWNKSIKKKDKVVLKYLESIEHLISDECHRIIDSKMFKQTINKCKNTIARHGFSGSPFSLTTDDLELESVTGPSISKVTMSDLIKGGYVSRPHIYMIKYDASWLMKSYNYTSTYDKKIVKGIERNNLILQIINDEFFNDEKSSILVLVRIIKHGVNIKKWLVEEGWPEDELEFIHGGTPPHRRKIVKELFKDKKLRLVIASQIWNEGIDIPAINVLIKADGGGGSEVKDQKGVRSVIQQVGRAVRKPVVKGKIDVDVDKENIVKIYDFYDNVCDDLRRHSYNRLMTYNMEPEFVVKEKKYDSSRS